MELVVINSITIAKYQGGSYINFVLRNWPLMGTDLAQKTFTKSVKALSLKTILNYFSKANIFIWME